MRIAFVLFADSSDFNHTIPSKSFPDIPVFWTPADSDTFAGTGFPHSRL